MQAVAGVLLTKKSGMTDTGNTLIPAGSVSSCSSLSFQNRVRVRRVKLVYQIWYLSPLKTATRSLPINVDIVICWLFQGYKVP